MCAFMSPSIYKVRHLLHLLWSICDIFFIRMWMDGRRHRTLSTWCRITGIMFFFIKKAGTDYCYFLLCTLAHTSSCVTVSVIWTGESHIVQMKMNFMGYIHLPVFDWCSLCSRIAHSVSLTYCAISFLIIPLNIVLVYCTGPPLNEMIRDLVRFLSEVWKDRILLFFDGFLSLLFHFLAVWPHSWPLL